MDGSAKCWGLNTNGQLGDNTATTRNTPVVVSTVAGATWVAAGSSHTCALFAGPSAKCWGLNTSGQLGDNTTTQKLTAVSVQGYP